MKILFTIFLTLGFFRSMTGPLIKISPAITHDFGDFPANEEKSCRFSVLNGGNQLLEITKVRHTCGCSSAIMDKMILKPGEKTSLTVRILKETIAGPFSKAIFIHSNAKNNRIQMVTLSGRSIPLVTVLPQNLIYAGTIKISEIFKQEFILRTKQKVSYGNPRITSNLPVTAKLNPVTSEETKLSVEIHPSNKVKIFKCALSIPIISPESWKDIEIEIQGKIQ